MERKQYSSLREIAMDTMPGDLIRHSSWPEHTVFACSTEFLMGFGNYPYADRPVHNVRGMPEIKKGGHWTHGGKYPPRANTVNRLAVRASSVPHHVPLIKPVRA